MNLALFDFDGTITTRETFGDFIRFAVPPRRRPLGTVVLGPLVIGYRLGLVSGNCIRAGAVNFGFRGVPESHVRQRGREFAEAALPGVIRADAMEKIAWHQAQGDTVAVVSGALDVYLSPWCDRHRLELICSRLEAKAGALTGQYAGAQCTRKEKARRVAEKYDLGRFPVVYAYGDTKEDLDLLRIASRRFYRGQEVA